MLLVATVVASRPGADIRTIEAEDWCLSYDSSEVEYASADPLSRVVGVPFFVVPWDTPTSDLTDDPERRGFFVRFWKRNAGRAQSRRDRRINPGPGMCLEVPDDHGLSRLIHDPDLEDRDRYGHLCPVGSDRTKYVPTDVDGPWAALTISCRHNPLIGNCNIVQPLESGWEITTLLPKEQLPRWREAADAARTYFEANFKECEAE